MEIRGVSQTGRKDNIRWTSLGLVKGHSLSESESSSTTTESFDNKGATASYTSEVISAASPLQISVESVSKRIMEGWSLKLNRLAAVLIAS